MARALEEHGVRTDSLTSSAGSVEPALVEAVDGPGKGAKCELKAGMISVGSDPSCDLCLDDSAVSRHHLTIELLAGQVKVRDLDSRNGTTYLGARIHEARLPFGALVHVGRTTLRIRLLASTALTAPAREEFRGLIGRSLPMQRMFSQLEKLGPGTSTVLLRGETGTGKDAVARVLHTLSPVSSGPFMVFDCGAVNANLIESELFGHARGAFSGADRSRAGAIEAASGGTLFLDEIGELPLELQPRLLRLLEAREFRRVGENTVRTAEVRIISATHRDLEAHVAAGKFRSDLYFRLAVAIVEIPPLRDRPEDIPLLASYFAKKVSGVDVQLTPATLAALQCEPWPGNVRELRNAVERAVTFGSMGDSAPPSAQPPRSYKEARDAVLERFERDYVRTLLEQHKGNVSAAAREAKLSRSQFYRILGRHGLAAPAEGESEE